MPVYLAKDDHILSLFIGWTGSALLSVAMFLSHDPLTPMAVLNLFPFFLARIMGRWLSFGEDYIWYRIDLAIWNRRLKEACRLRLESQMNGRVSLSELEERITKTYGSRGFNIDTEADSLTLTAPDDPVTQISIVPLIEARYSIQVKLYHCRLENRIPPFDLAADRQVDWEQLTELLGQYIRTKTKY
jgi:hypothetical protein